MDATNLTDVTAVTDVQAKWTYLSLGQVPDGVKCHLCSQQETEADEEDELETPSRAIRVEFQGDHSGECKFLCLYCTARVTEAEPDPNEAARKLLQGIPFQFHDDDDYDDEEDEGNDQQGDSAGDDGQEGHEGISFVDASGLLGAGVSPEDVVAAIEGALQTLRQNNGGSIVLGRADVPSGSGSGSGSDSAGASGNEEDNGDDSELWDQMFQEVLTNGVLYYPATKHLPADVQTDGDHDIVVYCDMCGDSELKASIGEVDGNTDVCLSCAWQYFEDQEEGEEENGDENGDDEEHGDENGDDEEHEEAEEEEHGVDEEEQDQEQDQDQGHEI